MSYPDTAMSEAYLSPSRSPAAPIPASPSMLRAVTFPTEDVMRVMTTSVDDFTATVASHQAQTKNQIALLTQLVQHQLGVAAAVAPRRLEFRGEPPSFDGSAEVRGWFRTLGLVYDAKGLSAEEEFRYTLPLFD